MGKDYTELLRGLVEKPQPMNKEAMGNRALLISERATLFEMLLCSRVLTPKEREYVEKQYDAEVKEYWEIVEKLDNVS